jgi:hypothetical protein
LVAKRWRDAAAALIENGTIRKGNATVVPDWGGRDLKLGTVRAAVRQLGIDWDEFERT